MSKKMSKMVFERLISCRLKKSIKVQSVLIVLILYLGHQYCSVVAQSSFPENKSNINSRVYQNFSNNNNNNNNNKYARSFSSGIYSESAIVDSESGRVLWQNGTPRLSDSISLLMQEHGISLPVQRIRAKVLSFFLLLFFIQLMREKGLDMIAHVISPWIASPVTTTDTAGIAGTVSPDPSKLFSDRSKMNSLLLVITNQVLKQKLQFYDAVNDEEGILKKSLDSFSSFLVMSQFSALPSSPVSSYVNSLDPIKQIISRFLSIIKGIFVWVFHIVCVVLSRIQFSYWFMAIVYVCYLLEAYHCTTLKYLQNLLVVQNDEKDTNMMGDDGDNNNDEDIFTEAGNEFDQYMAILQKIDPVIKWKVQCFHYEPAVSLRNLYRQHFILKNKRKKTSLRDQLIKSVNQSNNDEESLVGEEQTTEQQNHIDDSNNDSSLRRPAPSFSDSEVGYYQSKKVVTHTAEKEYEFDVCKDNTVVSIWKRRDPPFSSLNDEEEEKGEDYSKSSITENQQFTISEGNDSITTQVDTTTSDQKQLVTLDEKSKTQKEFSTSRKTKKKEKLSPTYTKIKCSKIVLLGNKKAGENYFKQQTDFIQSEIFSQEDQTSYLSSSPSSPFEAQTSYTKDRHAEFSTSIELDGFKPHLMLLSTTTKRGIATPFYFWLYTIFGLTLFYRKYHIDSFCGDELSITFLKEAFVHSKRRKKQVSRNNKTTTETNLDSIKTNNEKKSTTTTLLSETISSSMASASSLLDSLTSWIPFTTKINDTSNEENTEKLNKDENEMNHDNGDTEMSNENTEIMPEKDSFIKSQYYAFKDKLLFKLKASSSESMATITMFPNNSIEEINNTTKI